MRNFYTRFGRSRLTSHLYQNNVSDDNKQNNNNNTMHLTNLTYSPSLLALPTCDVEHSVIIDAPIKNVKKLYQGKQKGYRSPSYVHVDHFVQVDIPETNDTYARQFYISQVDTSDLKKILSSDMMHDPKKHAPVKDAYFKERYPDHDEDDIFDESENILQAFSKNAVIFYGHTCSVQVDKFGLVNLLKVLEKCIQIIQHTFDHAIIPQDSKFAVYIDQTGLSPYPPQVPTGLDGYTISNGFVMRPNLINSGVRFRAPIIKLCVNSLLENKFGKEIATGFCEYLVHVIDPMDMEFYNMTIRTLSQPHIHIASRDGPSIKGSAALIWAFISNRWSNAIVYDLIRVISTASNYDPNYDKVMQQHLFKILAKHLGVTEVELFGAWLCDTLQLSYINDPNVRKQLQRAIETATKQGCCFIDSVSLTWIIQTTLDPFEHLTRYGFEVVDIPVKDAKVILVNGVDDYIKTRFCVDKNGELIESYMNLFNNVTIVIAYMIRFSNGDTQVSNELKRAMKDIRVVRTIKMAIGFI